MLELDNFQRSYFGLDPIQPDWDKVPFKGDTYRPDSVLYFQKNVMKKQVISTEKEYKELQFNEATESRKVILPKTKKGKPKRLSPAVLESKTPIGVYLYLNNDGELLIGNHTTQTTFYSRRWEFERGPSDIQELIKDFIKYSPQNHFEEIERFRFSKRRNIKFNEGDFFAFKLNRSEYGFGRILLNIAKLRETKLLRENHGFNLIMSRPVLIKFYAYKSENKNVDIDVLKNQKSLPSDYIMDNIIFYGEYEIIGNLPLKITEFDFPVSYGRRIDQVPNVFLQWGLIHQELPKREFDKYLTAINEKLPESNPSRHISNPYGYYSIGFRPKIDPFEIIATIKNNGEYNYSSTHYKIDWDLRNPKNKSIRDDIFKKFGLNPNLSYEENRKISNTIDILDIIKNNK